MFVKTKPTPPRLDDVIAGENPKFEDRLVFDFQLTPVTGGMPIIINGHNIVRFSLDARSTGFVGELSFTIRDDLTFQSTEQDMLVLMFRTQTMLKIHLGIRPMHTEEDTAATTTAAMPFFFVDGLVTEKSLVERVAHHLEGKQINFRQYHLRFADPAQVLWRQHFPLCLYTQTSLQAVVTANLNTYIQVQFIDTTCSTIQPQIMLGMVPRNRPGERASFYDLLMWQLDLTDRIWQYDYTLKVYKIIKIKPPLTLPIDVVADDIGNIFTYYPAPQRYQEAVLNDYTEAIQNRLVTPLVPTDQTFLVPGVRQDFQWNTQVQLEFEKEYQHHTTDFTLPKPEFILSYKLFPSVPFGPWAAIDFMRDAIEFDQAAVAIPPEAKVETCRVFRLFVTGETMEDDVESAYTGKNAAAFKLGLNVWLEAATNPERRIPPYIQPKYPVYIEGKILSEIGAPVEETYQIYPDPTTFVQKYKAIIPLFQNQIITVPCNPNMDPGHFYFPPYKWERIVVAFYYDHSYLKRFLDWRPTAQLPLETQGDHLLLGKTPVNRTSVRHTYVDENPVFEIERLHVTNKIDCENIRIAEGSVTITVGMPLGMPPPGMPVQQTASSTQGSSSSSGGSPSSGGGQSPPRQGP